MKKPPRTLLSAFLAMTFFLGCCQSGGSVATIQAFSGEMLQVQVEIADTPAERAQGLMFRESLPEGTGMLFLYSETTQGSFWMKNTPISLDIIFIRDGTIVDVIENAVPYSEEHLMPIQDYNMVLEVPGGYAARHGIQMGDAVTYRLSS